MEEQGSRYDGVCRACGSRPAGPVGKGTLCERCGAVLELPDPAGLVEDEGAAVRREFDRSSSTGQGQS